MFNLKVRVGVIVALVLLSIGALWPRPVLVRARDAAGKFVYRSDSSAVMDTVKRINLKRGLDLQGGMHMALEVDESRGAVANKSEALENAIRVIRNRIDEFGVAEPVIQKVGEERIIVELPGIDDPERAERLVKQSAFLQFQILDETQALEKALPRLDQVLKSKGLGATSGDAKADSANKGLTGLFAAGGDSAKKPGDSTRTEKDSTDTTALFGAQTGGPLAKLVAPGSMPGEYFIPRDNYAEVRSWLGMSDVQAAMPPGKVLRLGADSVSMGTRWYSGLYVLDQRPILTGEFLTDADPATDPIEGTKVTFTLNNEGGRRFKNETARHIRDYLATVLDDRVMNRPAVIQSAIGTRGQITMGGRDLKAAQDFSVVLRAGALPVPLKTVEVRNIGPSLGDDSVQDGIRAGLVAIALVVLIMVGYYRFSGMLAVGALVLYVLFTLAVLAMFEAVLTLPGLAGFVLSIGIAVDANVLVFERIREELDRGKTVRTSIDEGFRHAMSAIVDTSLTTILTAAVLYQYGTGPVRGFAVTLIAGIAASLFTAIFVTKTFYLLWLNRHRGAVQTLSI
ncbi:MAG TPA: protein translocase subunit SecD [Gemmatimonadaceae bacterium]|nr:protein translocase subunit SecD [Gemmatimonadaceae bacterium]